MSYAAVIFDYGNVLSLPQDVRVTETMAHRLGVSHDAFWDAYHHPRKEYDAAAVSALEYWQRVLKSLDRSSMVSASLVEWLIERDTASWTQYREEMWNLVRSVRGQGRRTAILSNCPHEILARIRTDRVLESCFDVLVFSCEVGLSKPDPQIYRTCLERLGVNVTEVLFVDDVAANIEAAARLGWHTYQFAGDDPLQGFRRILDGSQRWETD